MPIEVYNRQRKVPGFDTPALRRRAQHIVEAAEVPQHDVCVTLLSDVRIHELNRDYRQKDRPTDVLSFAQNEGELSDLNPTVLGDVLISLETADRQRQDRSLLDEVTHLTIHGVLHLLGYDHQEDDDAEVMEAEERRIWAAIHQAEETVISE